MEVSKTKLDTQEGLLEVKLIDGQFTESEAADIINSLLKVKINFHKLQRLSRTEGNVNDVCEYDSGRIEQLIKAQEKAKVFFKYVEPNGDRFKITSSICITVENPFEK